MEKNVVITGADRGLGLAIVRQLLNDGWSVFGGHHSPINEDLEGLKATYPHQFYTCQVEIADDESVKAFAAKVKNEFTHVDMLVNNAGILGKSDATIEETMDMDDILHTINVNALGALRVSHSLLDVLYEGDLKVIVNISSVMGSIASNQREGGFGYNMSKAALNMSGSIIHQTLKKRGGRVIQIHPGYVKTYMHGHYNEEATFTAEESATMVLKVIQDQLLTKVKEEPAYVNYKGDSLPW